VNRATGTNQLQPAISRIGKKVLSKN